MDGWAPTEMALDFFGERSNKSFFGIVFFFVSNARWNVWNICWPPELQSELLIPEMEVSEVLKRLR